MREGEVPKSLIGKALNRSGRLPVGSGRWNSFDGITGGSTQDRYTMLQATKMQGTMYAIIQLLSTGSQAMGSWKMFRKPTDGRVRYSKRDQGSDQRTEVIQHQALRLWNKPNPFMTGPEFREIGWQFMELVGEWYWVFDRGPTGTGLPIEMWPVRPDRMEPVPDKKKFLAGWVYSGPNGEEVPLLTSEVIQLRYPDPSNLYRGLSPVQSILVDIDAARYSAEWSRNFFLNSAQPGGIVTFSKRLSDDEFTEFTTRWREQHQGVARGHRVGVLEQGALWNPNTYTMRDMQFMEGRGVTSDMIRQAYRIHQAMLGNSTDVNRANAQTAEEVHVAWHEVTRLRRQRNVLNTKYLEMFEGEDPRVEFDFDDPMPTSANEANDELTAKSNAAKVLVEAGWDPDDVLTVVGLPAMGFTPPVKPGPGRPPNAPAPPPGQTTPDQQPPSEEQPPDQPSTIHDFADLGIIMREAFEQAQATRRSNGHKVGRS